MADFNRKKNKSCDIRRLMDMDFSILDFIGEGVCILNNKFEIVFINDSALKILEYKEKEVVGKSIHKLLHYFSDEAKEYKEGECPICSFLINKTGIDSNEGVFISKTGRKIFVRYSIYSEGVSKDSKSGLIIFSDIGEEKEYEDLLKRAKDDYEMVFQLVPSAVFTVDLDKKILSWNRKAEEITGYSAKEIIGKSCLLFALEPCKTSCSVFNENIKKPINCKECTIRRKDGEIRIISKNSDILKNSAGEIIGGVESFEDITERKKLEESNLTFFQASEYISLSIMITDTDANIEYVNPKFSEITGYSFDEVIGKNPRFLKSGNTPEEVYKSLWNALKSGNSWAGEFQDKRKDGTLYWESMVVSVIKDKKGKIIKYIAVKEDITKARAISEELKIAKKAAEEANKTKSEFLANMSHEIRTPMNSVIGMAEILMDTKLDEEQRKYAKNIQNSSEALLGIINDILDISKIESGLLELENIAYNPREVIESVAEMFAKQVGVKDLELVLKISNNLPVNIMGDPTRLRQIFINLIGNAVKFTSKGQIKIEAEYIEDGLDKKIKFVVVDTGIGISKENQKKILEKFSQADPSTTRKFGGTGLGLSISRAFVELMGGNLSIESELKKGTTFYFEIPCIKADIKDNAEGEIIDFNGFRALVIDDNRDNLEIIKENLSVWGFKTDTKLSSVESFELIKKDPLAFNIIIIDHRMPVMDGVELVNKIREFYPKTPFKIIMMSSIIENIPTEIKKEHIDGFLLKPITKSGLFNAIVGIFKKEVVSDEKKDIKEVEKSKAYLKILVAEDNPDNQNLISILLKKSGYSFDIVSNGKEAADACLKFIYDLIFLDIQMPVMDGYEAIGKIRELDGYGKVPILALTAHALDRDIEKSLKFGMNEHITKPIKKRTFYEVIHKWIDSRKKVLIVDDSEENRLLVKTYLKREIDISPFFANNGKEALDLIERRKFSLVFMDMEMPIMDGLTAVKKLRKTFTKEALPIIAFSAHNDASKIKEFLDAGCNDYLIKPFKRLEFIEKVKTYIVWSVR